MCDCGVCVQVRAYLDQRSMSGVPSQRDRITHAQHLVRPATPPAPPPPPRTVHLLHEATGCDPSSCYEYLGQVGGYCAAPATFGLCPDHRTQREDFR